ncbi:MAG: aldehyde dehydrogenase family protein [Halolamina sp.]
MTVLNQSKYGNAAGLFTGSGVDARKFRHHAEVGNLGVNVGTSVARRPRSLVTSTHRVRT